MSGCRVFCVCLCRHCLVFAERMCLCDILGDLRGLLFRNVDVLRVQHVECREALTCV